MILPILSISERFSELTFGWLDALDIFLLAGLLFLVLHFLNNHKAGVLVFGVAAFLAIYWLSDLLHLDAMHMIFESLYRVGALALIIIFQPEIREALEKVGSRSIGTFRVISERLRRHRSYSAVIENICSAVTDLSASKTGALIVISGSNKLDDMMESGIPIHADVNSFLIRNLFFDKAPLHDGAIIIDDARIAAAGCVLPLTRRTDVDSNLGTRHRAAIGVSEVSDSVTVVVSEETGIISVAYEGRLERNLTPAKLKEVLAERIYIF